MLAIKNSQEAIDYIFQSIKNLDPDNTEVTREDVEEVFYDIFDDKIESVGESILNDIDKAVLAEKQDDPEFIEYYLSQRIPKYFDMLTDTIAEILADYMSEEEEEV